MAASLQQAFPGQVQATLIDGGRGIFDVKSEGKLLFSKRTVGRFPNPGEVETLVADLVAT